MDDITPSEPGNIETPEILEHPELWDGYGWLLHPPDLPPDVTVEGLITELVERIRIGTPWYDAQFWLLQKLSFDGSVAVQKMILAAVGIDVPLSELTGIALDNGWLTEDGASLADVGKLLNYYGIETHCVIDGTMAHVINELEAGNKVIVPVDSGELWAGTFLEQLWELEEDIRGGVPADHVVWITGIDMTDPENPTVVVNDTGDPDGAGRVYPLSLFVDAWEDANFSYVATGELPGIVY